jgi:Superfamily II DNA helicase
MQFQAGYMLDCVKKVLDSDKVALQGLITQLSFFDLQIDSQSKCLHSNENFEQILAVANNIISRGLPTRPSLWVEAKLLEGRNLTEQDQALLAIGTIYNKFLDTQSALIPYLFRALHIIDPDITTDNVSKQKIRTWEELGSPFEEDFLYNQLLQYASPMWLQLFEVQREIENLLRFSNIIDDEIEKYLNGSVRLFNEQRLDFSTEPAYSDESNGLIVEIDGSQHEETVQTMLDNDRVEAAMKVKWQTLRIKTTEWGGIDGPIRAISLLENQRYYSILRQNFENPLYTEEQGLTALELALTPFAVARVEKTIIHLLLENYLDINAKEWNIAVIERDIPCATLAIQDFCRLLNSLLHLKGEDKQLPEIKIFVKSDNRFAKAALYEETNIISSRKYDVLIDISVLQRSGLTKIDSNIDANTKITIRSAHSQRSTRRFKSSSIIEYAPLGKRDEHDVFSEFNEPVKILTTFVRDIFRKTGFRSGQVEILNRAIQGRNVIGLLPTGSGKSLTYQLASLLQPGMAIVVDPIKSLMTDQYEGLQKNAIDGAIYINSSLSRLERDRAVKKIVDGEILFAFISPERMQDAAFRNILLEGSKLNQNYFSYCVIDEAHCVSEWGHDFRTSYLRLGDNVRKYCHAKGREFLPIFALTATASYDVLSDIQRELGILENDAIVRLEKLDRPEIQFVIANVDTNLVSTSLSQMRGLIGKQKQDELIRQLDNIPKYIENFSNDTGLINEALQDLNVDIRLDGFSPSSFYGNNENAGLIFCPHRKGWYGVINIAAQLSNKRNNLRIGTFHGSDGNDERDEENIKNQSSFVENNLDLLVATKAFGMGIDKPNIRYVVHFNFPSSIESYYQEVGRCGRDRKIAVAIILFNKQGVQVQDRVEVVTENGEIQTGNEDIAISVDKDILYSFHKNNFKGIAKEKAVLSELLLKIESPLSKTNNSIEQKISETFGASVRLIVIKNKTGREVMYINDNYGSIYLDTSNLDFYPTEKVDAQEIGNYIRSFIRSNKPKDGSAFQWLTQETETSQLGIERLLEEASEGALVHVVIPVYNNAIKKIAQLAGTSERIIQNATAYCYDPEVFLSNIISANEQAYNNSALTLADEKKPEIKSLFTKIRNVEDTFKAVYRLSIIGVIDDYTIDYVSQTILATISRKPDGYYTDKLRTYLLQYNSPENIEKKLSRLEFYRGSTEIQRCLGFLIKFVYEETAKQRKTAIDAMESACLVGLGDGLQTSNNKFKEFINFYMNSKYARPGYLPKDTNDGLDTDFSIVLKYIDIIREEVGEINNLKHLRGATTYLLTQRPDNYVFMLLNAFSVILIEKNNDRFIENAQENFLNGFLGMQESTGDDALALQRNVDIFKEKLGSYDLDALEKIGRVEGLLFLRAHITWLSNFNNKLMVAYARPTN